MNKNPTIIEKIETYCQRKNIPKPTFFVAKESMNGMTHGITIAVPLSEEIIEEVGAVQCPTHSYFHHYRTVNFFLDQCMLEIGMMLQQGGYQYIPIGASQSIPTTSDPQGYHGRFSHKEGGCLGGMGYMGTSGLFLHKKYGPRVRLGTVLTNMEVVKENPTPLSNESCAGCLKCVAACPSSAIKGKIYKANMGEFQLVNPQKCSQHMKQAYKMIGRGSVCGICIAVCPVGKFST